MVSFMGAFTSTTSIFSVLAMLAFGILAILLEMAEIPSGPMMLAYILGGNLETYFRTGISYAKGSMLPFVTRPISCILLVIGIYSLLSPLVKFLWGKVKANKGAAG